MPVSATRRGVPQATVIMSESLDVLNFAWTVTRPGRPAAGGGTPASQAGTVTVGLHLEPPYLEISWYIPGISQGYDHLCRKTGIYQVYTCHMTTIFISQVYTWYIPVPRFFK